MTFIKDQLLMQVISLVETTYPIQTMTNSNSGSVKLHPTHVEETTLIPTNSTLHNTEEEVTGAVGGMQHTTLISRDHPHGVGGEVKGIPLDQPHTKDVGEDNQDVQECKAGHGGDVKVVPPIGPKGGGVKGTHHITFVPDNPDPFHVSKINVPTEM